MKSEVVSVLSVLSVALLVLIGCAGTPGNDTPSGQDCGGSLWSAAVTEDAVGESSAREALREWVERAEGLSTNLPAPDWVETSSSDNRVRFQGEQDWAAATHLPGGWLVIEGGTCG
jgi:hypothetical protein